MKHFALIVLCLGVSSCGGSEGAVSRGDFRIELYSTGGISGGASGVTVTGDAWARFWTGRTAMLRSNRDSMAVDRQQLDRILALADSVENSPFQFEKVGDLTTVITIQRKGGIHRISFVGEQVPASFPQSLKGLIIELRGLRKAKTEEGP